MAQEEQSTPLTLIDFTPASFTRDAVVQNTTSTALHSINDEIRRLDALICKHLSENYEALFDKASEVDGLHSSLQSLESKITTLSTFVRKLKSNIEVPYTALKSNVILFQRFKASGDVLRKIARITLLVKRIQSRPADLSNSATYVNELECLFSLIDWEGVHILESYKRSVEKFREDLLSQAWTLVTSACCASDQVQLGLGLQIFQHLGQLRNTVCTILDRWKSEFNSALIDAVDVGILTQRSRARKSSLITTGPGSSSFLSAGSQAAASNVAIWTRLDDVINKLELLLSRCRLLTSTLLKTRDSSVSLVDSSPLVLLDNSADPNPSLAELLLHDLITRCFTHEDEDHVEPVIRLFASSGLALMCRHGLINVPSRRTPDDYNLCTPVDELKRILTSSDSFLDWAFSRISEHLLQASEHSPQIKEVLEGEYPKLLKLVLDCSHRIQQSVRQGEWNLTNPAGRSVSCTEPNIPTCILRTLAHFETAYLSRSLSRLFDQVLMAFSPTTNQSAFASSQLNGLLHSVASELTYAAVHYDLLSKVSRNIHKTVSLCVTKLEQLIYFGSCACQITEPQTKEQENNIQLINSICWFGTHLELICSRQLRNLPASPPSDGKTTSPIHAIYDVLENSVNVLCISILQPLLQAIDEAVKQTLASMHHEDISSVPSQAESCSGTGSKYMQNLQRLVSHVRRQYFFALSQTQPAGVSAFSVSSFGLSSFTSFTCGEAALQNAVKPFMVQWIDAFLYNVAVCSQTAQSLLRLAADCTEFEAALAPLLAPNLGSTLSNSVPEAYAKLTSFRRILLLETQEIIDALNSVDDGSMPARRCLQLLPRSLVCQHLFSRVSAEIRPPHEAAGLSIARYIDWMLTGSSEAQRLAFLRNGLKAYADELQARKQKEYSPIYLTLLTLLQTSSDP